MQANTNFNDPYREYPYRLLGYVNAAVRPWKEVMPKQAYQVSLAIMHTYFLTNAYDYTRRVDSTSQIGSFLDCYTWHCCASWIGPAMVVDGVLKACKKLSYSRPVGIAAAYLLLPSASLAIDYMTNRYFYGVLSAGNRAKPQLKL